MGETFNDSVVNVSCSSEDGCEDVNVEDLGDSRWESTSTSSRLVEYNFGTSYGNGPRSIGMGRIAEVNKEVYNTLVTQIFEMGNIFFQYVNGETIKGTWRYITDVFLFREYGTLPNVLEELRRYGRSRRNGMFGFSVEIDHIHIIHDCAFSGGHCRDVFRKQIEPFGEFRPARSINKPIWKFSKSDWYDVFKYFFLEKRGTREIWIRGESWKEPSDGK
uniref:Nonstructural protein NS1 n=1 Tax=Aegithalos caudatus ambidensovirus TaxID=2794442 RepID=A0A8E7G273_9VIRU|nr:MAG: nonstructural protein NS1 [Aegithalos caudatus ambidensovirus]